MKNRTGSILFFVALLSAAAVPQTGGTFDLSHNVIASGGGSNSAGGNFSLDGTSGQPAAGAVSTGSIFSLRGGFWAFEQLAPTAAHVSVSGRVLTADSQGIRNVRITLIGADGAVRVAQTGTFGYFRFDEVEAGRIYILEISSKKYVFTNPTRVLNVQEEINGADFVAEHQ